ncbi:MAG: alpha/beta hydrolase fold domain-containing protein [Planctomycetota bacterium]
MNHRYLITLMAAGFALVATAAESPPSEKPSDRQFTLHKGLSYSVAAPKLKLDLFLPLKAPKPMPCVVVIQGGGFLAQDGQRFRSFAEYLAENGFAAALIAYRGRPEHRYQETVADVKAAVQFVRAHSKDYGIDPDRIAAMGRSAGATLAALLAVSGGVEELEGGHADVSSRIQAAVGIAGVYDFVARFTEEEQTSIQPAVDTKLKTNGEWIGSAFSPTDEHWLRVSAIHHVDAADAPMLLLHSKDDRTVPWMQSRNMHEAMKKAGIASEIEISETGGHGGPATAKESMIAFFRKVLVERGAAPDAESQPR